MPKNVTNNLPLHVGLQVPLNTLINLRFQTQGMCLLSQKRATAHYTGKYRSGFRGRGIEFDEVRVYQPGDDVRTIHWGVTARTGEAYTKTFHEERERPVFIIIDQGASMQFGTRVTLKSSIAAIAGALTAWTAILEGDRVGAFVFSSHKHYEFRPRSRKQGVLPLLKTLSETTMPQPLTADPTALETTLKKLRYVVRPGSLVFIYSDFSSLTEKAELQLAYLAKHCEIRAGLITDRLEEMPPKPNQYPFSNGEKIIELDTRNPLVAKTYHDYFSKKHAVLKSRLSKYQVPLLKLTTESDVVKTLQRGFMLWETQHE